jgi:hypothetical protein
MLVNYKIGNVAVDINNSEGRVYDESGRSLLQLTSDTAAVMDKVTNETLASITRGSTDEAIEPFSYTYQGVSIRFDALAWELVATVEVDVATTACSSATGIKVLVKKKARSMKAPLPAPTKAELAAEGHESVRSGVQSVMSQLDEMLSKLNAKGLA